jgi:hypothetical protein
MSISKRETQSKMNRRTCSLALTAVVRQSIAEAQWKIGSVSSANCRMGESGVSVHSFLCALERKIVKMERE